MEDSGIDSGDKLNSIFNSKESCGVCFVFIKKTVKTIVTNFLFSDQNCFGTK